MGVLPAPGRPQADRIHRGDLSGVFDALLGSTRSNASRSTRTWLGEASGSIARKGVTRQ